MSENAIDAIIEDIQDIHTRLFNILIVRPTCLHPTLKARLKETQRALFEAHNEAVRIKSCYA